MYIRKWRLGFKGVLYIILCLTITAAAAVGIGMYAMGFFTPEEPPVEEECSHEWKQIKEKEATCTEPGAKYLRCTICLTEKTNEIAPTGHRMQVTIAKPATCLAEGATAGERCRNIGCGYSKPSAVIPKLEHTEVVTYPVASEATCQSNSYIGGTHCSVCSSVLTEPTLVAPALNHVYEQAADVAPTCASDGSTGGEWCKYCHKFNVPGTVVPKITDRHTGNMVLDTDADGNALVANCVTAIYATCDCCGEKVLAEDKNPDIHVWTKISDEILPNCKTKEDGVTAAYTCSDCGITAGGLTISHEACHDWNSAYCTLKKNNEYVLDSNGNPMAPTETTAGRLIINCLGGCSEYPITVDVPPTGSGNFNDDNDIYDDGLLGNKKKEN